MLEELAGGDLSENGTASSGCVGRYIIRRIRIAHCKKGPRICEKCREMSTERACLLDICPPRVGEIQRRVIQIERDGETIWREFDIVRVFESEEEATAYSGENAIDDVAF